MKYFEARKYEECLNCGKVLTEEEFKAQRCFVCDVRAGQLKKKEDGQRKEKYG